MPAHKPAVIAIDSYEIVEFSTPPHWGITMALQDILGPPQGKPAARGDAPALGQASPGQASPIQEEGGPAPVAAGDSRSGGLEKVLPSGIASAHLEDGRLVFVPRGGSRAFRRIVMARLEEPVLRKVFAESHFSIIVLAEDGTPVFEQMLRSPALARDVAQE